MFSARCRHYLRPPQCGSSRLCFREASSASSAALSDDQHLLHPDYIDKARPNAPRKPLYAKQMAGFLSRPPKPTVLPPPTPTFPTARLPAALVDMQPEDGPKISATRLGEDLGLMRTGASWQRDSHTVDLLAFMDACMHNFYNVPRAKKLFDRMRAQRASSLETKVYNRVLECYLGMAQNPKPPSAASHGQVTRSFDYWLSELLQLYQDMETGNAPGISPDATTYALLFLVFVRFPTLPPTHPHLSSTGSKSPPLSPESLLRSLLRRNIDAVDVIASRVVGEGAEGADLIKLVAKAAVSLGELGIVSHLGKAESLCRIPALTTLPGGSNELFPDHLDGVPEVRPVRKVTKTKQSKKDSSEDATTSTNEDSSPSEDPEGEIPFNLNNIRQQLASVTLSRRVLPEDVVARQRLLEESMYDVALKRLEHEHQTMQEIGRDAEILLQRGGIQSYMWKWHSLLVQRFDDEIKNIQLIEQKSPRATLVSPYLCLLKSERLSFIVIMELMRMAGTGGIADGMKTTRALIQVGKAVELEYKAQVCKSSNIRMVVPSSSTPTSSSGGSGSYFTNMGYRSLKERRVAAARLMTDGEAWVANWSQTLRAKIGGILVDCLMEVATVQRSTTDPHSGQKITQEQPAFFHTYEHIRGNKLGVIRLNPVVAERLAKDSVGATVHPRHLPMLVKPKPWLAPTEGGYLFSHTEVMRFKDSIEQEQYLRRASDKGNVELIYAGLDVLGGTPWRINKKVFDVVLEQWNSGARLGKMPPAVYDQPEPIMEDVVQEELAKARDTNGSDSETSSQLLNDPSFDLSVRRSFNVRMKAYTNAKGNNHSNRCNVNYKMEIARAFLGDTLYQPHNLDFRGRAYPVPPHLNHIGDDLSRGLLQFAEGKPLGERGLRWLKIHLANLYGFDKASFDDRVKWTEARLDKISDSVNHPLDGERWWAHADDPWQCLATCFELHSALNSPVPEEYVSHQPVHQDGTCNGLQHYAALGGDAEGAAQVNLRAADKPSDVYSYVGRMVEETLEKDKAAGHEWARVLSGKITRKVVKQTVMTTVYGVTYVGARDQIEKQLKDRGDIPTEQCWEAAAYLTKVVLGSIGNLFSGASHIQTWLTLSARLIAKSIPEDRLRQALAEYQLTNSGASLDTLPVKRLRKEQMTSVVWTTPLGLPIVQPYRKTSKKQILTALQTVFISDPHSPAEVNSIKQASAFPPNFIHSLDATHMMLTALECRTQNITFAAVHDSYWTHGCSIDKMSEIIRETFVALHSSDILVRLREEFIKRYEGYKIPLLQMRSKSLLAQLHAAGVRLSVTPEQAKGLSFFSSILNVSDTEKSVLDDSQASTEMLQSLERDEQGNVVDSANNRKKQQALLDMKDLIKSLEEDNGEEPNKDDSDANTPDDEGEDLEVGRPGGKAQLEELNLLGKFVNLVDLIPPLPEKGNFAVEEIKSSPYFFS